MKILITGAGGLIGGYLASSFAHQGEEVIASYRNVMPDFSDVSPKHLRKLRVDISQTLESLEAVDVVIHAAAHTHLIPGSTTEEYVRSNVIGTINLAEYADRVKPSLFIYLSTISMFGQVNVSELREDTIPNGPGTYGMTKFLGEKVLEETSRNFSSISIRLPGIVGPGYFTPWLGTVLNRASRSEPITIYNPDSMFNNVIDLQELLKFVHHIIERHNIGFESVNLAASEPVIIRDVVNVLLEMTGSQSKVVESKAERPSFTISLDKLTNYLDFLPSTTKSMLQRYVEMNMDSLNSRRVD